VNKLDNDEINNQKPVDTDEDQSEDKSEKDTD
jgi:hypothetical protein